VTVTDWSQLRKFDTPQKKPGPLARLASYLALIVCSALIMGVIFWGWNVWVATKGKTLSRREAARERLKEETVEDMNTRFYTGAVVGAVIGAGWIGYYHLTHRDKPDG
jgi:hypothetical protein